MTPALSRLSYRAGGAFAYAVTAALVRLAESWALVAYNQVCTGDNRFVGDKYFVSPPSILIGSALIIALPSVLARSNLFLKATVGASVLTLLLAVWLVFSAGTLPYECVTMGGDYEDHASGLGEFMLCFLLILIVLYGCLLIDLCHWGIRKIVSITEHQSTSSI